MIETGGVRSILGSICLGVTGFGLGSINILNEALFSGAMFEGEELSSLEAAFSLVALAAVFSFLLSAIFIPMWFHRAYRNAHDLGAAGLQYTPGWAAGYFFVPIMNLFRPFQIAKEIWQSSDPTNYRGEHTSTNWLSAPISPVVTIWWASWLFANFSGRAETGPVSVASGVFFMVAAVALIYFMRTVDGRQRECMEMRTAATKGYSEMGHTPDIAPAD